MAELLRKGRALASKNKKKEDEAGGAAVGKKGAASGASSDATTPGKLDGQASGAVEAAGGGNDGCPLDKGELGAATWGLVRRCRVVLASCGCGPVDPSTGND